MSSQPVVLRVENVRKDYPVYASNLQRFARWFGLPIKPATNFCAVDDVSFELRKGETLGLIGQNGAGKSTLLKMITGTVRPNSGAIHVGGRISAILELGLGFNLEFTGRENVYHSGGLLGYSHEQLTNLMQEIEDFAEIGEHFYEPVRTYSSGMQARLAFALATAVRPAILIVDEVLSVGDSYFQHKSFARIKEFREQGTTIVMVTHSLGDIRELCDRVILLNKGAVIKSGPPDEVIDYYNMLVADRENSKLNIEQKRQENGWLHTEFGDGRAKMIDINLHQKGKDNPVKLVPVGAELEVQLKVQVMTPLEKLVIGHRITDRTGHVIWGTNTWHRKIELTDLQEDELIESTLSFTCNLGPGSYAIHFGLHSTDTHLEECFHKAENQIIFEVMNADKPFFIGSNCLPADFKISRKAAINDAGAAAD